MWKRKELIGCGNHQFLFLVHRFLNNPINLKWWEFVGGVLDLVNVGEDDYEFEQCIANVREDDYMFEWRGVNVREDDYKFERRGIFSHCNARAFY